MLPPDRAFRREANAQPIPGSQQLSAIQKVMRFAEKDDLLLYITATFGIFMPAIMYFIYKTMHTKYHAYQKRKSAGKRRQIMAKRNKRTITIFYCGADSPTKRIAYNLAEELDHFDPIVANLSSGDINRRIKSSTKAVFIFVVETDENGKMPHMINAFLDWLDEIRYEHRQKAFLCNVSYAIFIAGPATTIQTPNGPVISVDSKEGMVLFSRLGTLKGHPMYEAPITANLSDITDVGNKIRQFSMELSNSLKQFQYGAFDDRSHKLNTSDEESDDADDDYEKQSTESEK